MEKHNQESGQAMIELIIFLPLIITLYSVISGFASAINGSINQQKVTRSYFYYRVQNNSLTPGPKQSSWKQWQRFGIYYIGWKEKFVGDNVPEMPCYRVNIPFKNSPGDACEQSYSVDQTMWVRVGTVYGICGATYFTANNDVNWVPDNEKGSFSHLSDISGCVITQ